MKAFIVALVALSSAHAFALTTITLKKDLHLATSTRGMLVYRTGESSVNGNDYCYLGVHSQKNEATTILKKGATFTVTEESELCGKDWGSQCRLDISAHNRDLEATLEITCKDRGLFAKPIPTKRINKMLKDHIIAK